MKSQYNTAVIRQLLTEAIDDVQLDALVMDYFPPVYEYFAVGMARLTKIHLLLDYCLRQEEIENLLALIRERNPKKYSKYESRIFEPIILPQLSQQSPLVIKEVEFQGDYRKFTVEQLERIAAATIKAVETEMGSPNSIRPLAIKLGSLKLILEMPEFVASRLESWYRESSSVIEELGIISFTEWPPENLLGIISTAISAESSQDEFYFWVDDRRLVEATQIVRVTMPLPLADPRVRALKKDKLTVIGVIEEVRRQSESRTLGADYTRYGGQTEQSPLLPPAGFTYARCRVLDLDPMLFIPLREGVEVYLADEQEAGRGYNYPAMEAANAALTVGLLRNGGSAVAGSAKLDTRYILGEYGGHVNVTGVAGTGTKTSFLMVLTKMLIFHAQKITQTQQSDPLYVVPIVFNVKGNDLMWLNRPNRQFSRQDENWQRYRQVWGDELFDSFSTPFTDAAFYSYGVNGSVKKGLPSGVKKYSWGLQDVIEWGAERYLFSAESRSSELMQGVLDDTFFYISKHAQGTSSGRTLDHRKGVSTFQGLVEWLNEATTDSTTEDENKSHYLLQRKHSPATIKAALRRLNNVLSAARGVLVSDSGTGEPPEITHNRTRDPIVIDIDGLESASQRFVVAAIIERIKRHREDHASRRQRYIIVLDELNRFAPRGSEDEVSKLFEHVAAQLRSQGIILFGAQQKASAIAPLVWENAATKVLGRTGAVELSNPMWRQILPEAARSRAATLALDEKMILQDVFNYPMLSNIPMTPWATRKDEIANTSVDTDGKLPELDFEDEL